MQNRIEEINEVEKAQQIGQISFAVELLRAVNSDVVTEECGKLARKNATAVAKVHAEEIGVEVRDLAYSPLRDLVGVVRGVDAKRGTVDVHLGHGALRFYNLGGGKLVRPHWDEKVKTYTWEHLTVLRDEE